MMAAPIELIVVPMSDSSNSEELIPGIFLSALTMTQESTQAPCVAAKKWKA